ncbi:MAG: hypothetical protein M3P85_00090 [Actinomycetota bacterium]|nr:hypothetical protein [Actinomycetota bacterium]
MNLLEPPAFIWCIAGPHIGETLADIVDRKRSDVERFGWCLWAYGGRGNVHPETEVRKLAREYGSGGVLPLLMPDTGRKYPDNGVPFTGYRVQPHGPLEVLPDGMSPVTGGSSSWAFRITSLGWSEDAVIDLARYVAPYSRRGVQPLRDYLKGSHGRASAARVSAAGPDVERRVHVVATLEPPYAVFLSP